MQIWNEDEALFRLNIVNLAATAPPSPTEETRLLKILIEGKKAEKRLARQPEQLDSKLAAQLRSKVADGKDARRTLIQANGRLVISIAAKYTGHGLSLAELSQEGVLGLIRAIDKFDTAKGVRLSTYASYWIRQSVSRAVAVQSRTIRLPVHRVDFLGKIKKAQAQLAQTLGRSPDLEEIAAAMEESPENIAQMLKDGQETVSLEAPAGNDDATLADFIESDIGKGLDDQVDDNLLEAQLHKALAGLTARESRIIELRYGLRDGHPLTLQDVAERFGLTRERIRQIEVEALRKLRQPENVALLRNFI